MQVGALFGKYRLERLVSQDVMGEVWAAVDTTSRQPVLLRALPAEAADDYQYRERFARDAELAAQVKSPNVVPVYDFGQVGSRLFRVSPQVEGTNLWQRLEASGAMPPQQAVDVVTQMATGLQAVRAAGLNSQEVASANVLVRDNGQVLLSEVGLPTNAGNASGVYGLTTVLYECLTGTAFPWSSREPLRPSAAVPGVPAEFDDVVARGTALAPLDRYRSVSEFVIAASDAAGVTGPMRAATTPTGAAGIAAAAARNRKVLIGAAAAAAVVLIAVATGMLLGSGSSSEVARVVTSTSETTAALPTTTTKPSKTSTTTRTTETSEPEAAESVPDSDTGNQQFQTSATRPPSAVQSPAPGAPGVFACDPGYVHTPPPDGPCWAPGAGSPPPGQPQAPQAPPVQQAPSAPEILPCYPGYVHTPPPDGPCWAPG
ncbi:serine/threonine protein kinase [Aldersonia kunmingensis]|uniref:serine/threonine protein kinase n=1 Tax=Aldersonia kunmingensis TaxID=408066 RepID=UPI00082BEE97|nr:serine/threonine-protein kinase [Aldersonia kunmingensis]